MHVVGGAHGLSCPQPREDQRSVLLYELPRRPSVSSLSSKTARAEAYLRYCVIMQVCVTVTMYDIARVMYCAWFTSALKFKDAVVFTHHMANISTNVT
eukprot:CFRG4327T1